MPYFTEATLHFDGACKNNPNGKAGCGWTLTNDFDGRILAKGRTYLGTSSHITNNAAEYFGLIEGLEYLDSNEMDFGRLNVKGDSELVLKQVGGEYRVDNDGLRPFQRRAREMLSQYRDCTLEHVPRSENEFADELANDAIWHKTDKCEDYWHRSEVDEGRASSRKDDSSQKYWNDEQHDNCYESAKTKESHRIVERNSSGLEPSGLRVDDLRLGYCCINQHCGGQQSYRNNTHNQGGNDFESKCNNYHTEQYLSHTNRGCRDPSEVLQHFGELRLGYCCVKQHSGGQQSYRGTNHDQVGDSYESTYDDYHADQYLSHTNRGCRDTSEVFQRFDEPRLGDCCVKQHPAGEHKYRDHTNDQSGDGNKIKYNDCYAEQHLSNTKRGCRDTSKVLHYETQILHEEKYDGQKEQSYRQNTYCATSEAPYDASSSGGRSSGFVDDEDEYGRCYNYDPSPDYDHRDIHIGTPPEYDYGSDGDAYGYCDMGDSDSYGCDGYSDGYGDISDYS